MASLADSSPCRYFPIGEVGNFLAVGWLDFGDDYPTGETKCEVYEKLKRIAGASSRIDLYLPVAGGVHTCSLCQFDGPPSHSHVFVPGDGCLYVSPEAIIHYIGVHRYLPPEAFLEAVHLCPDPNSMAYKKAVLENGGREVIRKSKESAQHVAAAVAASRRH